MKEQDYVVIAATFADDPTVVHMFDADLQPIVPLRYTVPHPKTGKPTEITWDRVSGKRALLYHFSEKGKKDEKPSINDVTGCQLCGHKSAGKEETSTTT